MQATIRSVSPKPRVWDGPKGTLHFISVVFEDGSQGDYGAKPETSGQHIEALQALIGKPGDFELEPKPDYEGQKQFKIKGYPGQTVGKGGGKQYTPSWNQTEAGARYHELKTDRRTAAMQAFSHAQPEDSVETILARASAVFKWLRGSEDKPGVKESE